MAWLLFNHSAVSIVEHKEDPTVLICRARVQGDIQRFLGPELAKGVKVKRTPDRDYLFRAEISRETAATAAANHVRGVTYPNFKDSVRNQQRKGVYSRIWSAWLTLQNGVGLYGDWAGNYRRQAPAPARTSTSDSAQVSTLRVLGGSDRGDPYGNHVDFVDDYRGADGYQRRARPWYLERDERDERDDIGLDLGPTTPAEPDGE